MAWTSGPTWTSGDTITETKMDAITTCIGELQDMFATVATVSVGPTGSFAAGLQTETEVSVSGAATTKGVVAIPPTNLEAGLVYNCYCSDTGKVKVRLHNATTGTVSTAAKNWTFILVGPNP